MGSNEEFTSFKLEMRSISCLFFAMFQLYFLGVGFSGLGTFWGDPKTKLFQFPIENQ